MPAQVANEVRTLVNGESASPLDRARERKVSRYARRRIRTNPTKREGSRAQSPRSRFGYFVYQKLVAPKVGIKLCRHKIGETSFRTEVGVPFSPHEAAFANSLPDRSEKMNERMANSGSEPESPLDRIAKVIPDKNS